MIIYHLAMVGRLNTRRALRDLVLPRLEAVERRLERIEQQLTALADHPAAPPRAHEHEAR